MEDIKLIIEAIKKPYEEEHKVNLKSLRLRCRSEEEAQKLHKHYESACEKMRQYWYVMSQEKGFNNHDWLEKKLKTRPKKVRGQYKMTSRRLRHHPSECMGQYYTHYQVLGMMEEKLWTTREKNKLADYTDAMRLRFNTYLDWCIEWEEKYNEGLYSAQIDRLKVTVRKPSFVKIEPELEKN
jgi:hypothetical protein